MFLSSIFQLTSKGLSLYDITSNVTIDKAVIKSTKHHGVHLSPVYDKDHGTVVAHMTSTLRFCDASKAHFVKPGETYHFFNYDAVSLFRCRRTIKTVFGYSIDLFIKTTVKSNKILATFYDSENIDTSGQIGTFRGSHKVCIPLL